MDEMTQKQKQPRKKKLLTVLLCLLAFVLIVTVVAVIVWNAVLDNFVSRLDSNVPEISPDELASILKETDPDASGPVLNPDDVTMPTDPAETTPDSENVINILLVGQDRRAGQFRQRSDAMIFCTLNLEKKTLTLTSFMRDLWVKIPGYYNERLNVPYAIKGFSLLNKTLEYNYGVSADYNVEVDFSGFEKVINEVDGVDIKLTKKEANYLNKKRGWSLKEGMNHLNGAQALAYSRLRAIDSDYNRTNRQRTVLNALVEKAKDMDLVQLLNLATEVLPFVTTDMTNNDITNILVKAFMVLPELEVVSQRIPMNGAYSSANIGGRSVLVTDEEDLVKIRELLAKTVSVD